MKFSFTTTIYKTGVNPCVNVPEKITAKMKAVKVYILNIKLQNRILPDPF